MGYPITDIEGVGPSFAEKLAAADIKNTDNLLDSCCTRAGRAKTAEATGVSEKLILRWSNMADMMRINGVGPQFAELLEASGVDTVKELATRNADNLATAMAAKNVEKNLTNAVPVSKVISGWIDAAKTTDPRMTY